MLTLTLSIDQEVQIGTDVVMKILGKRWLGAIGQGMPGVCLGFRASGVAIFRREIFFQVPMDQRLKRAAVDRPQGPGWLSLSRAVGQEIVIGANGESLVIVKEIHGNRIRIGFDAPPSVHIDIIDRQPAHL